MRFVGSIYIVRVAKTSEMTVELTPITDADVASVAEFLHANHNDRVPWALSCSVVPWKVNAPNRGFMLRDGGHVVGTLLALYSERQVAGRAERFCNMGSWCVLPGYRSQSILLLKALLAQEGYHFTVLSPDEGPQEILAWCKFRYLDTSAALVPNLPLPTLPRAITISSDPDVIQRVLAGLELQLYRDHAKALAAQHIVLIRGEESCYVMYRESRYHGVLGYAVILHVSNPELFRHALIPLTRHLLFRHGLVATLIELRVIGPKPGFSFKLSRRAKMYHSLSLEPESIDDLYSELVCVPS